MSGSNVLDVELQALKSIYNDDLQRDADTVIIRVYPLQHIEENGTTEAQIDLYISCPENYPEILPKLCLKNSKGFSNKNVKVLTCELEALAKSLKGKPMMYDLACHTLNYLLDNVKPRRKSFYDEMICRKEQEQAKFKLNEDKRMKKIYDAQQKLLLKMEENNSSGEEDFENDLKNHEPSEKLNPPNDRITCISSVCSCSKYIHFENKVLRGSCVDHDEHSNVYCALDTVTGEQLIIREWILRPRSVINEVEKLLKSIQNELNYLKILNHNNINTYIDFKCLIDKDEWIVYISEKFISNITLRTLLDKGWVFSVDVIRYVLENTLMAILYLHDHKVVHKDLNERDIYFTNSGDIKISSYSLKKRMDDVCRLCNSGIPPDVRDKTDRKGDIWRLGLILSKVMALTAKTNDKVPDSNLFEFKDFIEKCLIKNEERRWGATELFDHKFLKNNANYDSSRMGTSDSKMVVDMRDEIKQLDFADVHINSRLCKDFYILEDIGKGSFGKVLKVRNKLDMQIYAIKEIKLDKNSEQLDKKIIGEVKLLSKLKHENVVRYYTSWIEINSNSNSLNDKNMPNNKNECLYELDGSDTSQVERKNNYVPNVDDDDDEDDDDEDNYDSSGGGFWRNNRDDGSSFIVFQEDDPTSQKTEDNSEIINNNSQPLRTLYIQMEFCEKSTLKYAIKNNLYTEESRCWRLLREIVEGLTYIHEQGLIHRDLKPDNIFLDSSDHVKIGDFGLAKIREMSKCTLIITGVSLSGGDKDLSCHYSQGDSNTAGVGTSYYVAPEMNTAYEKSHYNEKVDIFSLGIIFFEMCHPPFNTAMERHDVLTKLRKAESIIPAALEEKMPRQMELVKKLLKRDPTSRPSSQEILDDHVPPAEVEYQELKEIVRKTLLRPETRGYKYLISSCLNQKISVDEDITYQLQNLHSDKFHISLEMAKDLIENIFKRHGAVYLSTQLLLPQDEVYAQIESRVKLMSRSGAVVNLCHDLRVPFARYVTSKNIRRLRRYTIDRVYREQKFHGILPKELYECAFDIVSPSGNLTDEWEILSVMDEIINNSSTLRSRNCIIVLNHAFILRALLIYCNVEKVYSEIFKILMEAKASKHGNRQLEANLLSLELGLQVVKTLITYFGKEDTVYSLKEELLTLFCNSKEAYEKAEEGFNKLTKIIEEAENFRIDIPIRVRLGVVCNTEYCSDLMFELVCKSKEKRGKQITEVIMSGCRYDGLLRHFRNVFSVMNSDNMETNSAIGLSISLDKIAALFKEDKVSSEYVVVCSTDISIPKNDKIQFIKELRDCGINCYYEEAIDSMEELLEFCSENRIAYLVNLKEENGFILIMWWDNVKSRYREKKICKREVADFILKSSKAIEDQNPICYQRSDSKTQSLDISNANQYFNIHVLSDEKSLTRRKYENQIRAKISPVLQYFSSRTKIEVLGVDLNEEEISRLAMSFKHGKSSWATKILSTAERSSKKTYLSKICKKLDSFLTTEKLNMAIIMYSLIDDAYQIMIV